MILNFLISNYLEMNHYVYMPKLYSKTCSCYFVYVIGPLDVHTDDKPRDPVKFPWLKCL